MDHPYAFTPLIRSLPATIPFVGPEAIERERGLSFRARLGANESAFGISPIAREAMRQTVDEIAWYNDPENHDLRAALGRIHGLPTDCICVGAGIDDLLGLAVRAFISPGDPVVATRGAYPTFLYHVSGFGGALHSVPYRHDRNDLNALARAAASANARIVYLSNPDNPAGTWLPADDIRAFARRLPEPCIFILDEAYIEFAPEEATFPAGPIPARTIRMRTFSKAHGMAGARVGYAIAAPEIITAFEKIRLHFGVNRIAQAGALASLQDPAFVRNVVAAVAEGRRHYETLGREVGLPTLPSATNFVCFDAGSAARAQALLDALIANRIFVRKPSAPPLDRCFRVTVGTLPERAIFAEVLRKILAEQR